MVVVDNGVYCDMFVDVCWRYLFVDGVDDVIEFMVDDVGIFCERVVVVIDVYIGIIDFGKSNFYLYFMGVWNWNWM